MGKVGTERNRGRMSSQSIELSVHRDVNFFSKGSGMAASEGSSYENTEAIKELESTPNRLHLGVLSQGT